ncbi:hypothetical protein [Prolixibacter sp. NT017]|uniref:hypothetical protein n=1 Tax=Prolixibacter sp. NT017 TaxID=2652390 RepID=UPI001280566B|nr:hypothetical protein [Prolixibacter sp. NT017]GET27001.1 hypothetical protein NT017_33300 [Prolixibacter sp. NT017]
MFSTLTYKRLLLIVGWVILAVASATAQVAFVVSEGQTRNLFVENHPGSSYSWVIYNEQTFTTEATQPSEISFPSGNNQASIDVTWAKAGTYYVTATETNADGCTNTKAIVVNVQPNTSSIAFNPKEAGDCADPNIPTSNTTATVELFAADGVPLPNSNYPVTVDYKVTKPDGTTENLQKKLLDATDYSLALNGLVNNVLQDQVYDVVLVKATDKYGMEIHVSTTAGAFQYTIFKTPVTPAIQMN